MSRYAIANQLIEAAGVEADKAGLDRAEVVEALTTMSVQALKNARGPAATADLLRYEIDVLGDGDAFDIQRR